MTIVPEISWDAAADPGFGAERAAWREAVAQIAATATEKLPDCNGRIEKAVALVLAGDVQLQDDGSATIGGAQAADVTYTVAQGVCSCKDYPRAPHNLCKHRLGAAIARRALALARQPVPPPAVPPSEATPASIPPEFVVTIHGRDFVQFAGLLAMAHAQGLVSLRAEWISVSPDLALAQATATFADGRTFSEAADATPDNVNAGVKKHFPRVALTRAKARALRDALNIAAVAVEELGE